MRAELHNEHEVYLFYIFLQSRLILMIMRVHKVDNEIMDNLELQLHENELCY